ncbi:MAG: response regulator [Gammaproteobacteria bacterium]|nr:response regulator [Gammaproteobacteria bacterium]
MSKTTNILIVDDNVLNIETIARRLERDGFNTFKAESGAQAFRILENFTVDLILLDIMMPEMDGYQVLEILKQSEQWQHIPVVMITALEEEESVVRCIKAGADDYLTKPVNTVLLLARVNNSLNKKRLYDRDKQYRNELECYNQQLKHKVESQVKEIMSAQQAMIFATSKLAESKDPETGAHLERLRVFCKILSEYMAENSTSRHLITPEFIEHIYAVSTLHDIGKVGIPDNVLLKPGKLSESEWEVMRTHTIIGANTLRAVYEKHPDNAYIKMGIEIAESHHEKWDGSGYPHGLKGEEIPLSARILAVADVYDALTSVRCYKTAYTHEQSRQMIVEGSGKHFDPEVVEAFLNCETRFIQVKKEFKDDASMSAYEHMASLVNSN